MKKLRIFPALLAVSLSALAFTLGLFVGKNAFPSPITVSVPEEMLLPPPITHLVQASDGTNSRILSPVNINTASVEELSALPGIGISLAKRIVEYRENNGDFSHVEELSGVPGIGDTKLEAILTFITVGGTP